MRARPATAPTLLPPAADSATPSAGSSPMATYGLQQGRMINLAAPQPTKAMGPHVSPLPSLCSHGRFSLLFTFRAWSSSFALRPLPFALRPSPLPSSVFRLPFFFYMVTLHAQSSLLHLPRVHWVPVMLIARGICHSRRSTWSSASSP